MLLISSLAFDRPTRLSPLKRKLLVWLQRYWPHHTFLDFASVDGKRVPGVHPQKNTLVALNENDGPVGGGLDQPEEFYSLTSIRGYQVKYEGRDVRKLSFQSRTETWVGNLLV